MNGITGFFGGVGMAQSLTVFGITLTNPVTIGAGIVGVGVGGFTPGERNKVNK